MLASAFDQTRAIQEVQQRTVWAHNLKEDKKLLYVPTCLVITIIKGTGQKPGCNTTNIGIIMSPQSPLMINALPLAIMHASLFYNPIPLT